MVIREPGDVCIALRNGKESKRMTWEDVEAESGVKAHTIINWSHMQAATIRKLIPVLDALGMEMVIRYKGENEDDSGVEVFSRFAADLRGAHDYVKRRRNAGSVQRAAERKPAGR